ncbi:MAG: nucleoside hydrolase [Planctomycetaceae bacterium]
MPQKLLIDADPGIGDALAIFCALIDPAFEVVGLTATAGSVSGVRATRNIQSIVELMDPPLRPRIGGASGEEIRGEALDHGAINGPQGMGDFEPPEIDLHNRRDSAKLIIDLVRDAPNEVTILTLGPLTNIARAFELSPDLPGLIKGIVCLGGSVNAGGDVSATAEYNIWSAQVAAKNVLRSPVTKTLVPLDVSNRVVLTPKDVTSIKPVPSEATSVVESMLQYFLRTHRQHLGIEGIRLNAIAALASISGPDLFESRPMSVDVETTGELTRGMTVFDQRGVQSWQSNIDVLTGIDYLGIADYFIQVIRRV